MARHGGILPKTLCDVKLKALYEPTSPSASAETVWKKVKYTALKGGLQALGPRFIVPAILQIMLGRTTVRSRPEVRAECSRKLLEMRVKSIYPGVDAIIRRDDLLDRLGDISVPTLMIVGEEEKPFPVWKARRVARRIPGAELVVIPQAGHLSPIENPGPVTDAITRFLAEL